MIDTGTQSRNRTPIRRFVIVQVKQVETRMKKILLSALVIFVVLAFAFVVYVFATNRPLPQTEHDVAILERTIQLLADEEKWSRMDDRNCGPEEQKLSLYCALVAASVDVAGEFRHRAAALQEVRYAIEDARPDADYAHRLMDYNNDPDVTFDDMHAVLQSALSSLRGKTGGPGR